MAVGFLRPSTPTLGLRHAPLMFLDPAGVFRRMEDTKAYGWTLVTLLAVTTLVGLATVETGLIDVGVNQQTEQEIARLEAEQIDLLSRIEFSERVGDIIKNGEFTKLMTRAGAVAAAPLGLLVSIMVISSLFYAAVALSGRKPEYHTLMSVCTYAAVVEVFAAALRLAMMLSFRTIRVDTSFGLFVPWSAEHQILKNALSAVDPFRIWFWLLAAIGLVVTRQLPRRTAIIVCTLLALATTGARMAPTMQPQGGAGAGGPSASVEVS